MAVPHVESSSSKAPAPRMVPKVSVVTTVYNFEDIVLETVHSILDQTYRDLELIVVDDGSTDTSADRIEAVKDPRLKLVRAPHSGLPAAGLSRAFEHSRGELIAVTGADDVWLPHKIERQIEFFERHPNVGILHTGFHHLIDGEIKHLRPREDEAEVLPASVMLPRMITSNWICTPTTMLRRETIERAGCLFDTDPLLCGPEDFDLWLRLCEMGVDFGYIHEPLVLYRIRATSVSRNFLRNFTGNLRALEKAHARQPRLYEQHQKLVRARLSYVHRNIGRLRLIEGQPGGLTSVWQAVKFAPLSVRGWGWMVMGLCGSNVVRAVVAVRDAALSQFRRQAA